MHLGRTKNEKVISNKEKNLGELKLTRKALGSEDRKFPENQERLKSEDIHNVRELLKSKRKRIAKQMKELAMSIEK